MTSTFDDFLQVVAQLFDTDPSRMSAPSGLRQPTLGRSFNITARSLSRRFPPLLVLQRHPHFYFFIFYLWLYVHVISFSLMGKYVHM